MQSWAERGRAPWAYAPRLTFETSHSCYRKEQGGTERGRGLCATHFWGPTPGRAASGWERSGPQHGRPRLSGLCYLWQPWLRSRGEGRLCLSPRSAGGSRALLQGGVRLPPGAWLCSRGRVGARCGARPPLLRLRGGGRASGVPHPQSPSARVFDHCQHNSNERFLGGKRHILYNSVSHSASQVGRRWERRSLLGL